MSNVGAERLKNYIETNHSSVKEFCSLHGFSAPNVYNMINGNIKLSKRVLEIVEANYDLRLESFTAEMARTITYRRHVEGIRDALSLIKEAAKAGECRANVPGMTEGVKLWLVNKGFTIQEDDNGRAEVSWSIE